MKEFTYTITDPIGIHARPASLLVKEAKKYRSTITITKNGKEVNCLKLMSVMGLGVRSGETVLIKVAGTDEAEAAAGFEAFLKENF